MKVSPVLSAAKIQQAKDALKESDIIILRCFESSIKVPQEWVVYRNKLRAIASASKGSANVPFPDIPETPNYPENA